MASSSVLNSTNAKPREAPRRIRKEIESKHRDDINKRHSIGAPIEVILRVVVVVVVNECSGWSSVSSLSGQ